MRTSLLLLPTIVATPAAPQVDFTGHWPELGHYLRKQPDAANWNPTPCTAR